MLRTASQVALAVATFLGAACALNQVAGPPADDVLGAKLLWTAEHGHDVDLFFFGSSRTARSVDPAVFDRTAAAAGVSVRSFNLAAAGLQAPDVDFVVRQLIGQRPAGWRWAVIELRPWRGRYVTYADRLQRRQIFIHDARNTLQSVADAFRYSTVQPQQMIRNHGLHFLARLTAAGQGPAVWSSVRGRHRPWRGYQSVIDAQGVEPARGQRIERPLTCSWVKAYRHDPEQAGELGRRLSAWRPRMDSEGSDPDLGLTNLESIARQSERLRAIGVTPIYVWPALATWVPDLVGAGVVEHAFIYNDPLAHPDLFRSENRSDCHHLNDVGSRWYSMTLARDFADLSRRLGERS